MQCLWLTLHYPEPTTNGQYIYSKGLIGAARDAGLNMYVLGLIRPDNPGFKSQMRDGIEWRLTEEQRRPQWVQLFDPDPIVANRGDTEKLRGLLMAMLADRKWDVIVFDSIACGWALDIVKRYRKQFAPPPRLVFIDHNYETGAAWHIVKTAKGLRYLWKTFDALKVERLEKRMVRACDVVASNSPEDGQAINALDPNKSVFFLPPGYNGYKLASRTIEASVPRRAILVGSLDWPPKRDAVEAFLSKAMPILDRKKIDLQIVGHTEPAYLAAMRQRFPTVDFVGRVDDVLPFMRQARLALVPDLLGGFKLKGLDYVFNRLPILSTRVALPGMPLVHGKSITYCDSHEEMTNGVVNLIDDLPRLNALQEAAYDACIDEFDWPQLGRRLVQHIRRSDLSDNYEIGTGAVIARGTSNGTT